MMINCGWSKLWHSLRIHQDNICIKFAICVFVCFSLCLVCYFVENPKAKAAKTHERAYQHKLKHLHAYDKEGPRNVHDQRSTEKLIQIKDFLNEHDTTKPSAETHPDVYVEHGSGNYAEVSFLGSSNNAHVIPTESVRLLGDDLFMDYSSELLQSADADALATAAEVEVQKEVLEPVDDDELRGFNENIVVTLQEVPNTNEQEYSSKWSSGEQEYFLNDYSGPTSTDMVSEEFIISSDDKGNYMQISESPDDDYDTKYLQSPKFINSLLGQMSGLLNPPMRPLPLPPSPPVASYTNFKEIPLANGALEQQGSQIHPIWKTNGAFKATQTTNPFLTNVNHGGSWFKPLPGPGDQQRNNGNALSDYFKLVEQFFKGAQYP